VNITSYDQILHQISASYVLSYDVHNLTVVAIRVSGHCACAISRDLFVRGKYEPLFLRSVTPICIFTLQLLRVYDED